MTAKLETHFLSPPGSDWTDEMEAWLRQNSRRSTKECAAILHRSERAVRDKRLDLGIRRYHRWEPEHRQAILSQITVVGPVPIARKIGVDRAALGAAARRLGARWCDRRGWKDKETELLVMWLLKCADALGRKPSSIVAKLQRIQRTGKLDERELREDG